MILSEAAQVIRLKKKKKKNAMVCKIHRLDNNPQTALGLQKAILHFLIPYYTSDVLKHKVFYFYFQKICIL